MIRCPEDYNPIAEYWGEIQDGKVTVSKKIYKTYKKLAYDLENPGEFFYSPKRANHIIEFAENFCRHSKGKFGGTPVILELWEKAMLAAIFGFVDINGCRKYQRAVLIIGKKNGKSLLASVVGLYLLIADGEAGPEVYAVATKKDQAKIIWTEAKRMVKKSASLNRRIKALTHELSSEDYNAGIFKPLASDSDTLDGLNIHGALMDEFHQWKNGRPLYDIMADGITAREQPLIFMTSTAGTIREDIYDFIYDEAERTVNGYFDPDGYKDERSIYFVYELDERKEWVDEKAWYKANPGLGTIKNLRTLAEKVEKAKSNSMLVRNLVCKEFNIRETSSEAWLNFEDLNNTATFDVTKIKPRYFIGGTDLSKTTDLTAAVALFADGETDMLYAMSMFWIPEYLVERHVREDKIPYDKWIEKGLCRTSPGNRVHPHCVTEWYRELMDVYDIYPLYIGYDSWSAVYWVEEMEREFGKTIMIPLQQGKKTLSSPMQCLGADLTSKLVNYNNNPILKWCLANMSYEEDKNGNIQPCKSSRATRRIDGGAALLDAYTVYQSKIDEFRDYSKKVN